MVSSVNRRQSKKTQHMEPFILTGKCTQQCEVLMVGHLHLSRVIAKTTQPSIAKCYCQATKQQQNDETNTLNDNNDEAKRYAGDGYNSIRFEWMKRCLLLMPFAWIILVVTVRPYATACRSSSSHCLSFYPACINRRARDCNSIFDWMALNGSASWQAWRMKSTNSEQAGQWRPKSFHSLTLYRAFLAVLAMWWQQQLRPWQWYRQR